MQPRPIAYRAEIIGPLLTSVAAGECCSIIGSSGVGKSNMVQHMLRPEVIAHYLGVQGTALRFVSIDANLFAAWSNWGFFEGLYTALVDACTDDLASEKVQELKATQGELLRNTDQYAFALRQCSDLIASLCHRWRLVLLFDEFDPLFVNLSEHVLRNLRGLRDRFKYRLMYITCSRHPLETLRDGADWDAIESFVELLSLRELGLHPLTQSDAIDEVIRFAQRHQQELPPPVQTTIAAISGGHPALLRALVQQEVLASGSIQQHQNQLHHLSAIRLECTKIWEQLSGEETDHLLRMAQGIPLPESQARLVCLKGLVHPETNARLRIFSPIFAAYITSIGQTTTVQRIAPIVVDTETQAIFYYGADITGTLAPRDRVVLTYLWENRDRICGVEQIARAIEPALPEHMEAIELEWCTVMMRRLKRRLATLQPDQPVPLIMYRKLGYKLVTNFCE